MNEEKELDVVEEVDESTTDQETQADNPDVPIELRGLSPEVLKEAMNEIAPESEENAEDGDGAADSTSVKKTDEPVIKKPQQKIPYERFKSVLDKNNDLKAELEALKAEMAKKPAPQTEQQEPPKPQSAAPKQQSFRVTPEITAQIDAAIKQQAQAMCGLTDDDIDSMEYMDDDDQRKIQYQHAKKLAEARVYSSIEQARQQQFQRQQQMIEYHNRVAGSFNAFVQEQQAEPDYEDIVTYARGEFYEGLSADEQPIIMDAYMRVEHNTASPQDIAVVKRFFSDAKNSYRSKQGKPAPQKKSNTQKLETKYKQSQAFPRSQQVQGASANTGAPSVDALERMLTEVPWDEIPQEYKDLVMNAGMNN